MENDINQHQIFDNAFLTECSWHKRLLIPLSNEAFHKNIPEDAQIDHEANEQFYEGANSDRKETLIKRITDAIVRIENGTYHFECESKNDGRILLRVADYDMQIAINDAFYEDYSIKINLPETAVIFVRNHRKLPDKGTISYCKGDKVLTHTIPFIKVNNYSLEDMVNKHLYIFFPFYLVRYEHAIKHTPNRYDMIEKEAHKVYDYLQREYKINNLNKTEFENILLLCKDVVSELSKDTDIQERLENIMGTEVLLTAEERGIEKGSFNMALENIRNLMVSYKLLFDEACDALDIQDREKYRNHIN